MGKVCVVKICPSGRKWKHKKKKTSKSLSYFQPTTPLRLEKWEKSLGIKLKPTDYICHLHFKEEHVKNYEKLCINNEIKIFPTGRPILTQEASPTIKHQYIPISVHEHKASIIDVAQEPNSCQNYSKDIQPPLRRIKKQELIIDQEVYMVAYSEQTEDPLAQQTTNNPKAYQETEASTQLLENFKKNIKLFSILPPFWLYIEKPDAIEFIRMDTTMKQIKNHIRLNEDLSITVIFPNDEELALNDKINSFTNTYDYLTSVEKWPICVGTRLNNNRFSKTCKGVIVGDDTYNRNQLFPRCISCRILRNRILRNAIPPVSKFVKQVNKILSKSSSCSATLLYKHRESSDARRNIRKKRCL